MKQQTIAVVACYIGKLPWYFDYFIHSCKYNPSIDFYIITDDKTYNNRLPSNIKIIIKNLEEINTIASERIGFPINVETPYKLCDLKPTYGLIFEDLLKNYDFWAWADIDVIFGTIRNFITSDILKNFDLISVRPDWIPGCFLVFKNNLRMNTLFTHSKDYVKVLTSDKHFCFDETNFAHEAFTAGKSFYEVETEIESMMHVVKKLEADNYLKPYFDLHIIEGIPGKLKWDKGKLTYRNKFEVLLYHLIRFKKNPNEKKNSKIIPDTFFISPSRIY